MIEKLAQRPRLPITGKSMLERLELIKIFTDFLNETGNWLRFEDFLESHGYSLSELGMEE